MDIGRRCLCSVLLYGLNVKAACGRAISLFYCLHRPVKAVLDLKQRYLEAKPAQALGLCAAKDMAQAGVGRMIGLNSYFCTRVKCNICDLKVVQARNISFCSRV